MDKNNDVMLQILLASHQEHFKSAKELAGFLPLNHPRRIAVEGSMNDILNKIHSLKEKRINNPETRTLKPI